MLLVQLVSVVGLTARAADVTEAELMQAATTLARQYDANYAAKNPAGMAGLYATDGVLVSPAGPIIRGREALTAYYTKRFASGAKGHAVAADVDFTFYARSGRIFHLSLFTSYLKLPSRNCS